MAGSEKTAVDPVTAYAQAILAEGGPELIRTPEFDLKAEPGSRTFVAARYSTVTDVLMDEARFSLVHYDKLLQQVAGGTRFFLGVDTAERQERIAMLQAAQTQVASELNLGAPPRDPSYLDWIASVTREQAISVLSIMRRSRGAGGRVNFAREYAYLVTYLTAKRVFGIPGPDKAPFVVRLLMFVRNVMAPGRWLQMKGEFGAAMSMFGMFHLVFGHLFGNMKGGGILEKLGKAGSKGYTDTLKQVLAGKLPVPQHSLQTAFTTVRDQFEAIDDKRYWSHVTAIQYELVSAMTLLVGTPLPRIAAKLVGPEEDRPGIGWSALIAQLRKAGRSGTAGHDIIGELLRLVPGTRLLRTATGPTEIGGEQLNAGDRIMTLNDFANQDERAFEDPGLFKLGRKKSPLNFGPVGGPHACYGQFIARTMLREMLLAADDLIEPVGTPELRNFAAMPDDLEFCIKADRKLGLMADGGTNA
jgi:Cytochrome P450